MFAGFHHLDDSDPSSSPTQTSAGTSPGSTSSSRAFSPTEAKARLQDKQIEKGRAVMMRDYIPTHINIMLYGESGLGKTTCIRNLIGSWDIEEMGSAFKNTGRTSLELFRQDPKNLRIKLKPLRSEEANRDLLITFQDMPGWGDDINLVNSLRTVVQFLLRQRQLDFHAQDGGFPVHGGPNHRGVLQNAITVCLYFVPPHRIKAVDWIMMSAIGKLCAVVPVISKADTFTAKEMEDFKKEMMQVITAAALAKTPSPKKARTSGTGGATLDGIASTVCTNNSKPMTPAAAAARMNPRNSSNDGAKTAQPPSSNDAVRASSATRSNSSSDGAKAGAAAAAAAGAAKTAPTNPTPAANSTARTSAPGSKAAPPTTTAKAPAGPAPVGAGGQFPAGGLRAAAVAAAKASTAPAAPAAAPATASKAPATTPAAAAAAKAAADSAKNTKTDTSKTANGQTYVAPSKAAAAAAAAATAAAAAAAASKSATEASAVKEGHKGHSNSSESLQSLQSHSSLTLFGEGEIAACIELARDLGLTTYTFSTHALTSIEADIKAMPPFAVVGSPDLLPADAPEVEGLCCPMGERSAMPRELWPSPGEPYRRYPWGTAFPLNRSHSDLIILKQLLTGHCNTAIYDLLDDSWTRACEFADKYRKLLLSKNYETVTDILRASRLLEPIADEICNVGQLVPLEDRLRDEEQKKLQLELNRAGHRLRELEDTVRAQRRALASMQQQLSTVLADRSSGGLLKMLKGK